MTRKIEILEPYLWFGERLTVGQIYEVGRQYNGHTLRDKNADHLIEEGWAREVSGDAR